MVQQAAHNRSVCFRLFSQLFARAIGSKGHVCVRCIRIMLVNMLYGNVSVVIVDVLLNKLSEL